MVFSWSGSEDASHQEKRIRVLRAARERLLRAVRQVLSAELPNMKYSSLLYLETGSRGPPELIQSLIFPSGGLGGVGGPGRGRMGKNSKGKSK